MNIERLLTSLIDCIDPAILVSEIVVGSHLAAARSGRVGLAYAHLPQVVQGELPKAPIRAAKLARLCLSSDPFESAVGLAALNSALPVDEARLSEISAMEHIERVGAGKNVALIGRFPFADKLRERGRIGALTVFELPGRGRPGDPGPDEMPAKLPEAEVLAITATTLMNRTLERILALADPSAYKLLLGPSTPLSGLLLEAGLNALFGSLAIDEDALMRQVADGVSYRHLTGVRKVALLAE